MQSITSKSSSTHEANSKSSKTPSFFDLDPDSHCRTQNTILKFCEMHEEIADYSFIIAIVFVLLLVLLFICLVLFLSWFQISSIKEQKRRVRRKNKARKQAKRPPILMGDIKEGEVGIELDQVVIVGIENTGSKDLEPKVTVLAPTSFTPPLPQKDSNSKESDEKKDKKKKGVGKFLAGLVEITDEDSEKNKGKKETKGVSGFLANQMLKLTDKLDDENKEFATLRAVKADAVKSELPEDDDSKRKYAVAKDRFKHEDSENEQEVEPQPSRKFLASNYMLHGGQGNINQSAYV